MVFDDIEEALSEVKSLIDKNKASEIMLDIFKAFFHKSPEHAKLIIVHCVGKKEYNDVVSQAYLHKKEYPTINSSFNKFKESLSKKVLGDYQDYRMLDQAQKFKESLAKEGLSEYEVMEAVNFAIDCLSKHDLLSTLIAEDALKLLELFLDQGPLYAYMFAKACLKINTIQAKKVVERAFGLILKFSLKDAYNLVIACLDVDSEEVENSSQCHAVISFKRSEI